MILEYEFIAIMRYDQYHCIQKDHENYFGFIGNERTEISKNEFDWNEKWIKSRGSHNYRIDYNLYKTIMMISKL